MFIDTHPNWKETYQSIYKAKAFDEDSWLECVYDGEKFHFREYSYERLSDAVSYAKLQARKG
jgi:hypothetical protein